MKSFVPGGIQGLSSGLLIKQSMEPTTMGSMNINWDYEHKHRVIFHAQAHEW
ncbi:hypothetical protein EDO6_06134 [Paenibacillus xylanexedens]|nr:hypothetical protein EDO6_06134 [Paenibacillus xylanexedens]